MCILQVNFTQQGVRMFSWSMIHEPGNQMSQGIWLRRDRLSCSPLHVK